MTAYDKVVGENKEQIKDLIKHKQTLKLEIAEISVATSDTVTEIQKIEGQNHKVTTQILKSIQERDKLMDEVDDLNNLLQLVGERINSKQKEHR